MASMVGLGSRDKAAGSEFAEVFCNEEAVSLDPNAALLINKRRSDRQSSVTRTGVTKARQNHQQRQCNGRGRRQTERISKDRQGQKGRQQMVRVVRTVQVTNRGKYTWGKCSEMSDGAKQDFAVSA